MLKGNRIENKLTVSEGLEKYFRHKLFYVQYDEEIQWNPSILNIPAVTSLITFAWLAGAELRVNDLDEVFAQNMKLLYREFNKMHRGALSGRLVVKRAWENENDDDGLALFFSGGLDSTYSLYELMDQSPRLIMVRGFDYYMDRPKDEAVWRRWKKTYGAFAKKKGLTINFVETNSRACLREEIIDYDFKHLTTRNFWGAFHHGPLLIGLGAPLSMGRFNRLVISASRLPETPITLNPYSSASNTDVRVAWTGMETIHFGQINRYEKVNALAEHLKTGEITIRTCWKAGTGEWNCSICEKCGRVLVFMLTAGVDPNICGFKFTDETLGLIKEKLKNSKEWWLRAKLHWHPWVESLEEIPNIPGLVELINTVRGL